MPYKKKQELCRQEIRFCMQFFFGKCLLEYKIRFEVEKKRKNVWGNFKFTFSKFV